MKKDFEINYILAQDKQGNNFSVISSIKSLNNDVDTLVIPSEIEDSPLLLIDNNALQNVSSPIIAIPSGVTLGKNVFSSDSKALLIRAGVTPIGLAESLTSRNTKVLFESDCPDRHLLLNLGFNAGVSKFPVSAALKSVEKYENNKEEKNVEEKTKEKSLADRFFEGQNIESITEEKGFFSVAEKEDIDDIGSAR